MGTERLLVERSAIRQLDGGRYLLAEPLVRQAQHNHVGHRRVPLENVPTCSGKIFSPPVLMQEEPRPYCITLS